jgi:hypothetical protein
MQKITVEIRGVNSPEKFDQVKEAILGSMEIHRNAPVIYVDFNAREKAHLALANLNVLPGIKAVIVGD